ncbi:hypothetical protein scyTo_0022407, partial [Scyliorhinus torazame]|nr:hypothetical protein [Scyliorhinus torazame]
NIYPNHPTPPVDTDNPDKLNFSRVQPGGALVSPETPAVDFPPCKITDLQAIIVQDKVELEWTAPGEDCDEGAASRYEMRMSASLRQLRDSFSNAALVNLTNMRPQPFGSREAVSIILQDTGLQNRTNIYFAVRAYDKINQSSKISNIAKVSINVKLIVNPGGYRISKKTWIMIVVPTVMCLTAGIMFFTLCKRRRKRISVDA